MAEKNIEQALKILSRKNGEINKLTKEGLQKELSRLKLDTRGHMDVLKKRLKNYWKKQTLVASQSSSPRDQQYDYILVIDFEATCERSCGPGFKHEIIEFPIVLIDSAKRLIVDEFHSFVKPGMHSQLSNFCTELTGITQEDVNNAPAFLEVLQMAEQWMEKHSLGKEHTFAVATDGPWDMSRFMYLQCCHSVVNFPRWCRRWVNVRKTFSTYYKVRTGKLQENLDTLHMPHTGRLHSGIDDARNIAAIVIRMLEDGCLVRANEKLFSRKLHRVGGTDATEAVVTSITSKDDSEDGSSSEGEQDASCTEKFVIAGRPEQHISQSLCVIASERQEVDNEQSEVALDYTKSSVGTPDNSPVGSLALPIKNKSHIVGANQCKQEGVVSDENLEDLLVYWSLQSNSRVH